MNHRLLLVSLALFGCGPAGPSEGEGPALTREADSSESTSRVTIRRDAYGVPHIEAATDEAAMYGLGWASAHDRRFQMHLSTLASQGRLSEFFGSDYIEDDTAARVQMAWTAAERKAKDLDKDTIDLLQAYADGVNAYTAAHGLSPAFSRYGINPQTWTPAHSIAAWHDLVRRFSIGAFNESKLLHDFEDDVAALGSEEKAVQQWLDSIHPGVPSAGVVQLDDLDRSYVSEVQRYARSVGITSDDTRTLAPSHADTAPAFSHAFAVAPDRMKNGKSVLVADPQLPVLLPAVWYEFQLTSPSFNARGVGVPGSPGLAIGFTDGVAWGITAGGGEQADLFRLKLGRTANSYVVDGTEYLMDVSTERLKVKGEADRSITIRETRWGPVVTELVNDAAGEDFALKSVIFSETDRDTIQGMFGMMQADDLASFTDALDDWRSPSVNLIAADADDIYYSVIGGVPVRSAESPLGGWIAQDGSTWDSDWVDIIPQKYLPQVTSPADGALYSGNHRPAGDWYPLPLALPKNSGGHSNRSARLRDQLIDGREWSTGPLVRTVQNDCVDHNRQRVVQLGLTLRKVAPKAFSADSHAVLDNLEDWADHGSMLVGDPEPYVAANVLTSFRSGEAGTALTEAFYSGEGGMTYFLDTMEAKLADNPKYVPSRDVFAYLDTIFSDAADALDLTEDERTEAWKELGVLDLNLYTTFAGADLDTGEVVTTDPLQCHWKATIWSQSAQSYSQYVDFGGVDGSMKPPGQSERRDHPWYTTELDLWADGRFKPAPLSTTGVKAVSVPSDTVIVTVK